MGSRIDGSYGELSDRAIGIILVVVAAVALVLLAVTADEQDRGIPNDPATTTTPIDTGDGRFQTCNRVTEHGVTEHLDLYAARCGDDTYASDNPQEGP